MANPSGHPNLFVVGAPKCGTTSLIRYLSHNQDIFVPAKKEPSFLATDFQHRNKIEDAGEYASLYADAGDKRYACDGSTFYLYSQTAARNMQARCPNARVIILLRKPTDQINSMFRHNIRRGNEDQKDLGRALALQSERSLGHSLPKLAKSPNVLQYEAIANYTPQVQRYLAVFPRDQIHIELFEDFVSDTPAAMQRILRFLDLGAPMQTPVALTTAKNVTATSRRPWSHRLDRLVGRKNGPLGALKTLLPSTAKARLRQSVEALNTAGTGPGDVTLLTPSAEAALAERLAPGIECLATLLGRDLSHWHMDKSPPLTALSTPKTQAM